MSKPSGINRYLSFLTETDNSLKIVALEKLVILVDEYWAQIADKIGLMYFKK